VLATQPSLAWWDAAILILFLQALAQLLISGKVKLTRTQIHYLCDFLGLLIRVLLLNHFGNPLLQMGLAFAAEKIPSCINGYRCTLFWNFLYGMDLVKCFYYY
jgi:hypothetical protein